MLKKIAIFVGSRANYGRLKPVINELRATNYLISVIGACTLNQTYDENIGWDCYIHADMYDDSPVNRATTIGLVSIQVGNWFLNNKPDMAIVHGDRFECLGFAIAANMANIPIVHMEAGEVTNVDNDVRWAISALSKIHIAPTMESYSRLVSMGYKRSFFLGSPVVEYLKSINFRSGRITKYALIMYNPNSHKEFTEFLSDMEDLIRANPLIKFIWLNPNIDPGHKRITSLIRVLEKECKNLEFKKNIPLDDYLNLLYRASVVIGNTSSAIKEGYVLSIPYAYYGERQGQRETFHNLFNYSKKAVEDYLYLTDVVKYAKYRGELGNGDTSKLLINVIDDWFRSDNACMYQEQK